jgi:hypothetical protein
MSFLLRVEDYGCGERKGKGKIRERVREKKGKKREGQEK